MPERVAKREQTVAVKQGAEGARVIEVECTRYVIEYESLSRASQPILLCSKCHQSADTGLSSDTCLKRRDQLGPNVIAFQMSSVFQLFQTEMRTGFYLYQFMMYQVWIWDGYLVVGCLLASVVLISAGINIWLARNGEQNIVNLCGFSVPMSFKRNGEWKTVPSADLVPGDIVKVEAGEVGLTAPADLAMLRGSAVCDEAGLTGESMPVGKTPLPVAKELLDSSKHKSSIVWGGTKVLQAGTGSGGIAVLQTVTPSLEITV